MRGPIFARLTKRGGVDSRSGGRRTRANILRKFLSAGGSGGRGEALNDSPKIPFHDLVRRLDVRLRLLGLGREFGFVAAAVALAMFAPRLVGDGLPWLAALVAAAGVAALLYRSLSGLRAGAGLDRAAAAGDRAGGLSDELSSAQWFSAAASPTVWETHQIGRARRRADEFDAAKLLPFRVPRASVAATATLAVLAGILALTEGPLVSDALRARLASGLAGLGASESEDPLAGPEAREDIADARVEARSPEEILAELRAGELRLPEDSAQDVDALKAALTAAMEERSLQETSEEVSAALAGLAEAMDSDSLTAAEWLEGLSEAMRSASTPDELQALLESLEQGAEGAAMSAAAAAMMELMEGGMSADEALQQLAESLQAMEGQQMNAQGQGEAQQMPFPGDGEGGGQPQAGEGGEPAAGMPQGAAGLSGQVQMMAAEGQMGAPIPMDAGPAGNMTGPGGGGESEVFGAATSLEVQLEMEAIPAPLEEERTPEQIIERQSRREDATVAYGSVSALTEYADETVSNSRPIPTGLRPLVRAYFLMIRETAKADAPEGAPEE